eukprot:TRINITY_DN7480_c0_g1_i2.p1 TRINITY_DN7480_c0_g1~~TRINITY_DN7480_c0_g1_i2.p1  ORF type:complete len:963 (-),score=180.19 TRINITY_DN7480_c0_g1_i2:184-3072(-)
MSEERDDVAFLTGSNSSESRLYSKRDLYERGHVAVCSHRQALCITVFVFSSILATSIIVAFARPWNDCHLDVPAGIEPEIDTTPHATNGEVFPWDDVRLPIFIRPISYDLELTPNLTTHEVRGIIKLIFQVTEETEYIVFHSKNISITSKTINEKLKVVRILQYPPLDQVYLETDRPMRPGRTYSIRLKFEYSLEPGLEGFYLSHYKDAQGNLRSLATTHFEPTSARRAFPCFDEPQLKAKFLVTITHDRSLRSFFNMPIKEQSDVRGKKDQIRNEFYESAPMSSYLVAFVVCDFDLVQSRTKSNVTIRVLAAKNKMNQTRYALDLATNITENYEKFFGIDYPLPKQDLIAIPDFGAGAMENWGLITYRETSLLYDPDSSSTKSKQWIATVIAHELAHQWFGNLVTMQWWNDLWLNEGFASWMEYEGVDKVEPQWNMKEQFWATVVQPALTEDGLQSSHPISVPVKDPHGIEGIFDIISYNKGSSIIRMLENFLGESVLRFGLRLYLEKHKYGNAVTKDLWAALAQATNYTKDVEGIMNTWTLQMGYPLLTFTKLDNSSSWNITQSRFIYTSKMAGVNVSLPVSKFNYTWIIPVKLYTSQGHQHQYLISPKEKDGYTVDLPEDVTWIKANSGGYGYYRVQYPQQVWMNLITELHKNHTRFSPADRAQLIDDAFALCKADLLDYKIPLELSKYLQFERDLVPWKVALRHLADLKELFGEGSQRKTVLQFSRKLLMGVYNHLGWEDKGTHNERLLRLLILRAAVDAKLEDAVNTARQMYTKLQKGETLSPELQELVYCAGIENGKFEDWEAALHKYGSTQIPAEKVVLLKAMTCTRDTLVLQQYLDLTLDRTMVRSQDVSLVLTTISRNPSGTGLAWRHLRRHWDRYFGKFGEGSFTISEIIKGVTSSFSTQFDLEQVESFFEKRKVGAGQQALKQAIETIKININYREKTEAPILAWIQEFLL